MITKGDDACEPSSDLNAKNTLEMIQLKHRLSCNATLIQ